MRWNRDRGGSRRAPLSGWKGYEKLDLTPASGSDSSSAKTKHDVQMLRTISTDSMLGPYSNEIHDIEDAYKAGIGRATQYISVQGTQSSLIPDDLMQLDGIKVPNGTTAGDADGGGGSDDAGGGDDSGPGSTASA